jgi:hypothetical protein
MIKGLNFRRSKILEFFSEDLNSRFSGYQKNCSFEHGNEQKIESEKKF